MGYRMTVINPENNEIITDSKLYGYIKEDAMRQCKSLQWLIDHDLIDCYEGCEAYDPAIWDYGYYNTIYLSKKQFEEFIQLYVEDRNTFYCDPEYPDNVYNYFSILDWVKIEWR